MILGEGRQDLQYNVKKSNFIGEDMPLCQNSCYRERIFQDVLKLFGLKEYLIGNGNDLTTHCKFVEKLCYAISFSVICAVLRQNRKQNDLINKFKQSRQMKSEKTAVLSVTLLPYTGEKS